jgi:hypothetical protein
MVEQNPEHSKTAAAEEGKQGASSQDGPQPHHKPCKEGISFMQIQMQYEACIREAASYLICNYSSLNMAIDMGFAGRKQIASDANEYVAGKGKVSQLKELIGGKIITSAAPGDVAMRVQIIEMLVELLAADEVEVSDIEDCLDDFMEQNFNTLDDGESHTEMAQSLISVRD